MRTLKVIKDSTPLVWSYPVVDGGYGRVFGRPSSASCTVHTPATSTFTSRTATIDAVSTTTNAAADKGNESLSLAASVALRRFGRYAVTLQNGKILEVESAVTATDDTFYTREPLFDDVASGASVYGLGISATLLAADTATVGESVIKWVATINGTEYKWSQAFWVVERIPQTSLTPSSLTSRYPLIRQLQSSNDALLVEAIDAAWSDRILPRLEAKGILEERIATPEKLEAWHAVECVYHLARQDPSLDRAFVAEWQDACDEAEDYALQSKRFWYDETQDLLGQSQANADDNSNSPWTILRVTR